VEVDLASRGVAEDEVPRARVVARHRAVPLVGQGFHRGRLVASADGDVDVAVWPGLRPEAGVDGPSAVEPHLDTVRRHEIEEGVHVGFG
jgi:hypothetical protein